MVARRVHLRTLAVGALLAAPLAACGPPPLVLPMGGISPGRGRPLPVRHLEASLSIGSSPDVSGTVPEIRDDSSAVINHIPSARELPTTEGSQGIGLGIALGVTDWLDVGASHARGVYATLQLLASGPWSLAVSPAYYRYRGGASQSFGAPMVWTDLTNQNLTVMGAVQPGADERVALDFYAAAGLNRYTVTVRDREDRHSRTAPSLLFGATFDQGAPRGDRTGAVPSMRLTIEGANTWLTQRDGRRAVVPTVRLQLALGISPAW